MKRIVIAQLALAFLIGFAPVAFAQNQGEAGVFVDYFRHERTKTNFVGLGGRASFNVRRNVQLEAEMSYDFDRTFTEGFTNPVSGAIAFQPSHLRVLHGLFGPKFQTSGPMRAFFTVKAGFVDFRFDPRPPSFTTFTSTVENLRANNVNGVVYPGGGFETFFGPLGLRFDIGDEIYFRDGARNNLRIAFGPTIRF